MSTTLNPVTDNLSLYTNIVLDPTTLEATAIDVTLKVKDVNCLNTSLPRSRCSRTAFLGSRA